MRPSAGTPYFARVPETLVSPQAPQDRERATGIASPLRTPEPKGRRRKPCYSPAPSPLRPAPRSPLSGPSACRKRHRTTLGGKERRAGTAAACRGGVRGSATVLPDQAPAADGPSPKPNPGYRGHPRDQRSHRPRTALGGYTHETHHHHYHRRFPAPYPAGARRRSAGDAALKRAQHTARTDPPRPIPREIAWLHDLIKTSD